MSKPRLLNKQITLALVRSVSNIVTWAVRWWPSPLPLVAITSVEFHRHTTLTLAKADKTLLFARSQLSAPLPPPPTPLPPPSWMSTDLEELLHSHSALSLPLHHRRKSRSCSSSWPPKTPRSNACRPSCWPEAAWPMTVQREVRTHSTQLTPRSHSGGWVVRLSSRITATSNQPVSPLLPHSTLRCLTLCCPLL